MTADALALVVFDVDGTLIDSQDAIVAAMRAAFDAVAQPQPTRDAIKRIVGLELYEAAARLAPSADSATQKRIGDAYVAAFVAAREAGDAEAAAPMYPGARAALERLARVEPMLLGVATGKARRGLEHTLDVHALRGLFATTQTCSEAPGKPAPGMLLNALAETGAAPARAAMVGDTTFDMAMAKAAGVHAVGVSWGYHPVEELLAAGADVVIDSFDALDAALGDLIGPVAGLLDQAS